MATQAEMLQRAENLGLAEGTVVLSETKQNDTEYWKLEGIIILPTGSRIPVSFQEIKT